MEIEQMVTEGWERLGSYAGYEILGKEQSRVLYDLQKKEVYLSYEAEKLVMRNRL